MDKFRIKRIGHGLNARKALIKLGIITTKDLAYMGDAEVEDLINESDFIVLDNGDDWILLPKELEDKMIWISR